MKDKRSFYTALILNLFLFFAIPFAHAQSVNEAQTVEITPSFLFVGTKGDRAKFEEDNWTARNVSGGIESMSFSKKLNSQDSLEFEGRAIAGNNDYNANLNLSREGVGSLTVAFKEFRKYFDGTGGFYENFSPSGLLPVEIGNPLHLNIGNFKIEGILAKENSPEYSLSYERDFRSGTKSLLDWGSVVGAVTRKIYPNYLETHETVDTLKAGVKYTTKDSEVSAEQMWESSRGKNKDDTAETLTLASGALTGVNTRLENMNSNLYSTVLRSFKDLNDKVSVSCGLLYNNYHGGSLENLIGTTNQDNPAKINRNSVTLVPNISLTPFKHLFVDFESKAQFVDKSGISALMSTGNECNITSDTTDKIFTQLLQLKYNGLKDIVFYSDIDFEKKLTNQFEEQVTSNTIPPATDTFSRKTNTTADTYNFTLGSKWYPISKVNITVEDKYREKDRDNKDEFLTGDAVNSSTGYIDHMKLVSNSEILKLNYKPLRWISTTLGYTYDQGIYGIRTKAGSSTEVAKYTAQVYSVDLTLTPADYLYCSVFYERRNDFTSTRADGAGGSAVQLPDYKANVDVLGFDYSYAFTKSTTLSGSYSMYFNDNFNDFSSTGLPLGLNNFSQGASIGIRHSFNKNRSLELKYNYKNYSEDSNNHINDYEAHLLFAAMNMRF